MTETRIECEVCGEYVGLNEEHDHSEQAVVIREGASLRTADDLSDVFVRDACSLLDLPYPEADMPEFTTDRHSGLTHLADFEDGSPEVLNDLVRDYENRLGEAGYVVMWDDGFVIYDLREASA